MPILRISKRIRTNILHNLLQRLRPRRRPQANGFRVEVDIVRKIVPCPGDQLRVPLRLSADHPAEGIIIGSTAEPAVFQFRKVVLTSHQPHTHTQLDSWVLGEKGQGGTSKKAI
ncbi:hypothetical protein GB937_004840 [Aspergillus fischeri]|nr:hypothetical protein GB937_004840 [Aspergillus fischeri]